MDTNFQDEYNIQQLYLFVCKDRSEEVLTVVADFKQEILLLFLKLKSVGVKAESSEDESYYVGVYSYNNSVFYLKKEGLYQTMFFSSKGQAIVLFILQFTFSYI
ncbi:Hypothetical_protein [Hexamita inflata]|uniref:Hypothetical_protein n=1 Tax=Hexamita inflata TaxID=28002 RepID=A0AA86P7A7_9EUKA|nr:Hypothetical protein HINF_LOCUS19330 [Hexamita inflata]CAI9931687.1 Hypothetical protein HINF_LOCUS19332 [Hexamita inflata]